MSAQNDSDKEVGHALRVLYRKVGIEGWRWFQWKRVGNTNDSIYTGCVPNGVFSKGPRKGTPRFRGGTFEQTHVVTEAEMKAERARWEAETGKCGECLGEGQTWAGWNKDDGNRYRPCSECQKPSPALDRVAMPEGR